MTHKLCRLFSAALCSLALLADAAHGQGALERVRNDNILRCGAAPRAGFAEIAADGQLVGLGVDVCRALSIAVLGPSSPIAFQLYDADHPLDALQAGRDDVAFVEQADMAGDSDILIADDTGVFDDAVRVMVTVGSPIKDVPGLANRRVCIMIGSAAQRALDALDARLGLHVARLAFEEDVEMLDAYNAQRCDAAIAQTSRLQQMSEAPGITARQSRLLPEPLAHIAIEAAVIRADRRWYDAVHGFIGIFTGMTPETEIPGLRSGWKQTATSLVGSFQTMLTRNMIQRCCLATK